LISVDATAFVIMALVFALVLVLRSLFFEPLARAIETRASRISRAASAWDDAQKTIRDASGRVGAAVQGARNEGYQDLDRARTEAQTRARAGLEQTRGSAQQEIAEARERLRAESDRAVRDLEKQADALASSLASRILGRDLA
jgi:F-type H+-transporting ATPase subunit b